jgi:hypothetical protein
MEVGKTQTSELVYLRDGCAARTLRQQPLDSIAGEASQLIERR